MATTAEKRTDSWSTLLESVGQTRSEQDFSKLFAHFGPQLKGFLQSSAGQPGTDSSEELLQEVMIKIWMKSPGFDPTRSSASTWIFTVARNTRIDFMRKSMRHDQLTDSLESDDIWDEASDNQPFVYLHRSRSESQIASVLGQLPQEQRICIEKGYKEGKSHAVISEELSLPLGTVKSRVRLGLKKLQSLFSDEANR